MTPVRFATKAIPAFVAVALLAFASFAIAQLQLPKEEPAASPPAAPAPDAAQPDATRRGAPQSATDATAPQEPAVNPAVNPARETSPEPAAPRPAETKSAIAGNAPAHKEPATASAGPPAQDPAAAAEKAPVQDVTAFIAALAAAERANENLAARIAQMEASAALQRERDQTFIRDMIKGVLLLSGGMAALGILALVAIVYLQIRSTKQQAITFAAQLQAISSHAALPGPGAAPAALHSSKNHFDSTARNIEERLSDLESMANGLPGAHSEVHEQDIPAGTIHAQGTAGFPAPPVPASNGEKSSDLLAKANSLLMQQQPEVALTYLDQAIRRNPRNSEAHVKRGAALERLNRLDDAIKAYDRAIEVEPTLSVAFLAKAGVLNKLQRYGEALKCYEIALAQQGGQTERESPAA